MSFAGDIVTEVYRLAARTDHKKLRPLIADDATWDPAPKAKWNRCDNADEIVRTLLWRTSRANRMRPGEMIELGSSVAFRVRGKRLERLGAHGLLVPKLFQVVEVRDGKIVRMHDHGKLEDAIAATGHNS